MKKAALFAIVYGLFCQFLSAERPMNEIPMRGGECPPTVDRNPAISRDVTKRGWDYYYQGDYDTAIKRFNQGWMFDQENPEVYWGFGLVMGQRASKENPKDNLKESVRFLQMAKNRAPGNVKILVDLAFSYTVLGHYFKSEERDDAEALRHFEAAGNLFNEAFRIDAKYPTLMANWSVLHFYMGDYSQAKDKMDRAIKMGYHFSPDYIKELEGKLQ